MTQRIKQMKITQEYLEGLKDGRAFMQAYQPSFEEMLEILDNLNNSMKNFSAGPVKEMMKGERDFWKFQIKTAQNAK